MSDSEHEETASYNSDGSENDYFSDEESTINDGEYPTFGDDSDNEDGVVKPKINIGIEINDSIIDDEIDFQDNDDDDEEDQEDYDMSEDEGPEKESNALDDMQQQSQMDIVDDDDDEDTSDDDDEDEDEDYLKKFDREIISNYVDEYHPESRMHNYDEVRTMSTVVRGANGEIIDDLHRTLPFMTKFEKARILGNRAKQLNEGAQPFVKVPPNIVTGYTIAQMELEQKRIPFILRRPIPGGGSEYWKASDLELII